MVELLQATRDPTPYRAQLARWVSFGASPRATLALERCARARAWLAGRSYVDPEDVTTVGPTCCITACCCRSRPRRAALPPTSTARR